MKYLTNAERRERAAEYATICNMAEEDGVWLTCLGDIQRERDRAVLRTVPE